MKPVKAWALVEDGRLCHYYALAYITFTKTQARIEASYKNGFPLNHKMKILEVLITPITKQRKGKKK